MRITEQQVRDAFNATANGRKVIGRVVHMTHDADKAVAWYLASAVLDTNEADEDARFEYMLDEFLAALDMELVREPVTRPQDFDGPMHDAVIAQIADQAVQVDLEEYGDWRRDQHLSGLEAAAERRAERAREGC